MRVTDHMVISKSSYWKTQPSVISVIMDNMKPEFYDQYKYSNGKMYIIYKFM